MEREPEDHDEPQILDTRDPFLISYISQANPRKTPLTVIVGGTAISGTYLDTAAYADLLSRRASKQRAARGESSDQIGPAFVAEEQEAADQHFLHLYDCQVFGQNNGHFGLETIRIRIMDVQAWMPGGVD